MFVRINEDSIVNTDHIVWIYTPVEGKYYIELCDGTEIFVNEKYRERFAEIMSIINRNERVGNR